MHFLCYDVPIHLVQLKEMINATDRDGRTVMAMAVLSNRKRIVDTVSAVAENEVRQILWQIKYLFLWRNSVGESRLSGVAWTLSKVPLNLLQAPIFIEIPYSCSGEGLE